MSPHYDYLHQNEKSKCKLGVRFERFESMSAQPRTKCEECGAIVSRCVGGGCGIIFRGPGFYVNDYKKKT